jgi:two-component system, NarL family, sensor histidine kinase DesK
VSRRALEDVRAAVGGYRRLTFDSELVGARVALETAGVATEVDHQAGTLPAAIDETFAWSVREGATNVVRHAQARRTYIRTRQRDGSAALEIVNDGPQPGSGASQAAMVATGSGLAGLTERAGAIGGRVDAGPLPEGGFRLAVVCPLEAGGG